MGKIVYFNDLVMQTFPFVDEKLYFDLKSKHSDIVYVVYEDDARVKDSKLYERYKEYNLHIIKSEKDILGLLNAGDILVARFSHKYGVGKIQAQLHKLIKKKHIKLFLYDIASIDSQLRAIYANDFAIMGKTTEDAIRKRFNGFYSNIHVTGTIHQDSVTSVSVDKGEFMTKYNMDSSKKLVILTIANPAETNSCPDIIDYYRKIVEIVQIKCGDKYEIAINAHPADYNTKYPSYSGIIKKNTKYGNKSSWEVFARADVIVNIRSSVAMEAVLFYKPILNIEFDSYIINWPRENIKGLMSDVNIDDLERTLMEEDFCSNTDLCNEYISKHFHANDGLAYKRISGIITGMIS